MPLQPVTGTLHLPLDDEEDARTLFEAGVSLEREPNVVRRQAIGRDLADHLFYLGAVRPDWAASLRSEWFRLDDKTLRGFGLGFAEWIPLLTGAEDADVDRLADALERHPGEPRLTMLAAVGTPHADDRLARLARRYGLAESLALMGIAVPTSGPVKRRFTAWQKAVRKIPFLGDQKVLRGERHPIGLPLRDVAEDDTIAWHYLFLDLDEIEGLPPTPTGRLHLVGPQVEWGWTLLCDLRPDGRYRTRSLKVEEQDESWELPDNDAEGNLGRAELLAFDDRLTYCNGHVLLTLGVVGTAGGPPLGLYPNPICPACERLKFHVFTVDAGVREYGDGFRSLFLCEDCGVVACNGTSHN